MSYYIVTDIYGDYVSVIKMPSRAGIKLMMQEHYCSDKVILHSFDFTREGDEFYATVTIYTDDGRDYIEHVQGKRITVY